MFRRIKTKLEKKDETPTEDDNQKFVKNELSAGFGKIFGIKKNQESDTSSTKSVQNDSETSEIKNETFGIERKGKDKISSLIRLIKSSHEKVLVPKLDLSTGLYTYPQLTEIGEDPKNIQFLENLTSDSIDLLEKTTYERIAVCSQHPDSLDVNVRLYCPKCHSVDIEKLHLFEHKVCGYISETKNFTTVNSVIECPSCKKTIKDKQKEIRIPAMWYNCNSCNEKFDDIILKMYCRKFNHDFDTNMAGTVSIPGFILKDSQSTSDYDQSLLTNIKDLLQEHKFITEENFSLKGKSGHYHNIDLIATNPNTDTVFICILKSENTIDESGINSKIIEMLDCNPTKSVIIGHLSKKAGSLASRYDISIIDSYEKDVVLTSLSEILIDTFTTEKLENDSHITEEKNSKLSQKLVEEKLVEEKLADRRKLEEERLEAEKIEAERQRLGEEKRESERIESERLAERKRLEEERKKVERIESERLAERKKLESEMLSERKRAEIERLTERKKLDEEKFADKLQLKAEKQRVENERKKVEKLEAERKLLEEEKKKAELLAAEKLAAEQKRKKEEKKQAEKRTMILEKLEETENQLRALKSSFDSDAEMEE
ncbi:MAG: hypothetical protein IH792_04735 [Thaumarchaeota archaeon]|nr:hypothetical protein [Nitrososphaerota archaeon]